MQQIMKSRTPVRGVSSLHHVPTLGNSLHVRHSKYAVHSAEMAEDMEKKVWRRPSLTTGQAVPISFNEALKEVGHGCFHILLFITCGLIYMACSASITTLSFTLPASTCDLDIKAIDKGIINTAPYVGMIIGTFVWGVLSDRKGRRTALIACLCIDILATIASSLSFHKWVLMSFRVLNGFGIIGATSLVFAYLGEFVTDEKRDSILSSLEFFFVFGMMYIPGVAWLILPRDVDVKLNEATHVHSWNVFTVCTTVPAVASVILLFFLPESPRFTQVDGNLKKTLEILKKMYAMNHSKRATSLQVECMIDSQEAHDIFDEPFKMSFWQSMKEEFSLMYHNHKQLMSGKTGARTLNVCLIDFFFNLSYLTLIIWIPELLERNERYHLESAKEVTLCEAVRRLKDMTLDDTECDQHIENSVYLHTIYITMSCMPVVVVVYFAVKYIRKKYVLATLLLLGGVPTVLFNVASQEWSLLLCCCCFEAFATLCETLLFVCIVDIFPTNLSGTALAVTACCGRIGAIAGSVYIGGLLEHSCETPIYTFGASLIVASSLAMFLPPGTIGH